MTQQGWSERYAKGVAAELRRHRELRGMSAQELADACASIGAPIQRSVIANLENGRRASVGIAEVMAFAAALKIPPISLIVPLGYESEVEILPGVKKDPYMAAYWIMGMTGPEPDGLLADDYESPMTLADSALMDVDEVLSLRDLVSRVGRLVLEQKPQRDQLKSEAAELEAEFQRYADEDSSAVLDLLEPGTPEYAHEVAESRRILEKMKAANERLKKKMEELSESDEALYSLQMYQERLSESEAAARRSIGLIREKGWLPPGLPEDAADLLEQPEISRKSSARQRSSRRGPSGIENER
ncbi:helix-turn-helix transcriptional regulator [Streptomyces sp. SBC-4]|nr:helix-turn-helix transcriptional regulator [Streptomyces sp. SBC-4]MDV5147214.1 helix-turn-helix transcriptional regulator [Streptomyces sp. SBC-4]